MAIPGRDQRDANMAPLVANGRERWLHGVKRGHIEFRIRVALEEFGMRAVADNLIRRGSRSENHLPINDHQAPDILEPERGTQPIIPCHNRLVVLA